ncbi:MAG: nucleotidyltransferase domain-containing protein, partial [Caldilineaceae bacterium]|nr:nucleotidyltransferase domain-containing protein [Caldilineaceae bacterium]
MNSIEHLPVEKQALLREIVERLCAVEGVAAVVLGGSYAGGGYHAASDLDVGIYYYPDCPFAVADVRRVADAF